ncbi:MAG: NAD(P)-dependent oxidoreductase [Anaerolineae bacterium]|nr:NAD(P)-dependent oxidoreductase [Anaerolineae bacterium]
MSASKYFVITGGAGYIGSMVAASLLARGDRVLVIDTLDFGGDGLLSFLPFANFAWTKQDVTERAPLAELMHNADAVIHLAALVGFPACNRAGRERTWQVNVEGTQRVYETAAQAGVDRFIFASSYSNYGLAADGEMVTEQSPLQPQSSYAESKVAAEQFLLTQSSQTGPAVTCLRLATVFGVSPRTRFDLMVNQFAWQAHQGEKLVIYQENFRRAFVHVRDVARAMLLVADAPRSAVAGQIFNVGNEALNSSKQELVMLLQEQWPALRVELQDRSFGGDMRSLHVSFEKIRRELGFTTCIDLRQGLAELHQALTLGWITNPADDRHRNHPPLLV